MGGETWRALPTEMSSRWPNGGRCFVNRALDTRSRLILSCVNEGGKLAGRTKINPCPETSVYAVGCLKFDEGNRDLPEAIA